MRHSFILFLLLIAVSMGCMKDHSYEYAVEEVAADGGIPLSKESSDISLYKENESKKTIAEEDIVEKIIKTANLRYPVKDIEKAYASLFENIKKNGGIIQIDNSGVNYQNTFRNLTIRVPSKNFDSLLNSISKDVPYFDTKSIFSLNVTEEFIDVEARLKNKKTLENRYLELLNKTSKISEIIEIEKSLSLIREEIESVQGRLNYLKDQVSYSTVNVEIYHTTASGAEVTKSYTGKIWNSFVSGFYSVSSFLLILISIWPYLIIILAIFFLIRRRFLKGKKHQNPNE